MTPNAYFHSIHTKQHLLVIFYDMPGKNWIYSIGHTEDGERKDRRGSWNSYLDLVGFPYSLLESVHKSGNRFSWEIMKTWKSN